MRERRGSNRQAGLSPLPPSPSGMPKGDRSSNGDVGMGRWEVVLELADVCGVEWGTCGYLDIEMFFVLAMFGLPNYHCL